MFVCIFLDRYLSLSHLLIVPVEVDSTSLASIQPSIFSITDKLSSVFTASEFRFFFFFFFFIKKV